jgi:hypothetical protein
MSDTDPKPHCRFITSLGGAAYCQDPPCMLGYCEFHFDCFQRGEINEEGRISDLLADQERRRKINFHGLKMPEDLTPVL